MDQFLSKYQCGFRKGFSAKHCLLVMLKKWKIVVDTKNDFGALQNLSKAFHCLPYDLIIAKLDSFSLLTLTLS